LVSSSSEQQQRRSFVTIEHAAGALDERLVRQLARQVGIAEQRDALGGQLDDGAQGLGEAQLVLAGQAVDDVDVDVAEAERARLADEPLRLRAALVAMDRVLDRRREVLDAHRERGKARRGERLELARRRVAWIELHGSARRGGDVEVALDRREQAAQRVRRQEVRRAAAERDLGDRERRAELLGVERHLGGEHVDIDVAARDVACGDDVAAAVPAQALAERDVHVQRGGAIRAHRFELARDRRGRDRPEFGRGRIARVAGPASRCVG
jgi:hypothetical protein